MNENRKVFVYQITSRKLDFNFIAMLKILSRELSETGIKLRGCRFIPRTVMKDLYKGEINCYFILLDNPLPTPVFIIKDYDNYIERPCAIIQMQEFEATWKKKSKNKDHILYGSFGAAESFITHYAESIINNLNKLKLCKKV